MDSREEHRKSSHTDHQEQGSLERGIGYAGILPPTATASQESNSPDSTTPTPQDPSHHSHMHSWPEFAMPTATTYPEPGPRELSSSGISPSTLPLGHTPYTSTPPGTGNYTPLPPLADASAGGMQPVQSYSSYGSAYQPSTYGTYGASDSSYPYYGASSSMPYSTPGATGSEIGYTSGLLPPAASSYAGSATSYSGLGSDSSYAGSAHHPYPYYNPSYPQQQYQGYGYYGSGRGRSHYRQRTAPFGRSNAVNPGKPFYKDQKRSGPDGANLFVFYIPNDMTNEQMLNLFKPYGNVVSARIMTEEDTGRGRGFGFVSYDCVESAARAIHFLNGFEINGKHLKVQHKKIKPDAPKREYRRHPSPAAFVPVQQHAGSSHQQQDLGLQQFQKRDLRRRDSQSPEDGFVPVQEYAGSSGHSTPRVSTPVLPEGPMERASTPLLPPAKEDVGRHTIESESAVQYQDPQKSSESTVSSLANLKDIGKALPDLNK